MWREHKLKTIYYHRGCGGGVCREIGVNPRYMLLLGYSFEAGLQSKFFTFFLLKENLHDSGVFAAGGRGEISSSVYFLVPREFAW